MCRQNQRAWSAFREQQTHSQHKNSWTTKMADYFLIAPNLNNSPIRVFLLWTVTTNMKAFNFAACYWYSCWYLYFISSSQRERFTWKNIVVSWLVELFKRWNHAPLLGNCDSAQYHLQSANAFSITVSAAYDWLSWWLDDFLMLLVVVAQALSIWRTTDPVTHSGFLLQRPLSIHGWKHKYDICMLSHDTV